MELTTMTEITDIYNFLPLTDDLLTSGQPTEEQFTVIAKAGVKAVINLALATSSNAIPNEPEITRKLGMQYYHIPVLWDDPSEKALTEFMDTMDKLAGEKVLIHCAANMRVPAFVALYRILRLGWSEERAFKEVYPIWNPYDEPGWSNFITKILKTKK
jgi:protein tyrosine phosphatase (PTP) superfamily phosphohydrolase (DUF442 family)